MDFEISRLAAAGNGHGLVARACRRAPCRPGATRSAVLLLAAGPGTRKGAGKTCRRAAALSGAAVAALTRYRPSRILKSASSGT